MKNALSTTGCPGRFAVRPLEPAGLGGDLWRGPLRRLRAADHGGFLPRVGYAVLPLNSGSQVYFLGGLHDMKYRNDVWLLRLGASPPWLEVSRHQDPIRAGPPGSVTRCSKWSGRMSFGAALATVSRGRMALYICGGQNAVSTLGDVWASEDSGQTWFCMCQNPPFKDRVDPGLVTVPGRYGQLILCGGWSTHFCLQPSPEVWISSDAGATWEQVGPPAEFSGRARPLLAWAPGQSPAGSRRLYVLGGVCVTTEGRVNIQEGMLSDAWAADVDFDERSFRWGLVVGTVKEGAGFTGATASLESGGYNPRTGAYGGPDRLVAVIDGRLRVSILGDPLAWTPVNTEDDLHLQHGHQLALVCGPHAKCPQLFFFAGDGAYVNAPSEVRRQTWILERLGMALEAAGKLPSDFWSTRILPMLLPACTMLPSPVRENHPQQ